MTKDELDVMLNRDVEEVATANKILTEKVEKAAWHKQYAHDLLSAVEGTASPIATEAKEVREDQGKVLKFSILKKKEEKEPEQPEQTRTSNKKFTLKT